MLKKKRKHYVPVFKEINPYNKLPSLVRYID